ncbi:thiolase C-terminal domain-containing protein [Ornithinimicrobium cavernae]|uniref:thiolase C-terminal domain-containing protein n=1 Tax=Ornithinimicrobium cavernae TaxID=2666047 RepID=UPI000D693CD0|nr:transporter [Ornithinimicrobium cavernae]
MASDNAIIRGIGQTDYSRQSGRTTTLLAVQAALAAAVDAGLDVRDLDGVVGFPHSVAAEDLVSNLGLRALRFSSTVAMGGASSVAAVGQAALAVESGRADHVLVVRARNGNSGGRIHQRPSQLPAQHFRTQLEHPYGWNTAAQRYAMMARRYDYEHGLDRQVLAEIALAARSHANRNPAAMMHERELTMEKYLAGRMIADPYTLYDCCLETDGACAVIVSRHAGPAPSVRVLAVAEGRPETPDDLTNRPDLLRIGLEPAAREVWECTGLGPTDMDAAMIYDCFTFEVLHQLEAAGFAPDGLGSELVASGGIRLGGQLPVNTHGGLLSEGHLSGLNHVLEAVRQLRADAPGRQVEGARHIAVTGWGDLGDGSMTVLAGQGGAR